MKLQYCSFTGADDAVKPQDLAAISRKYPFVEWGILFWPKQTGISRIPTSAWIKDFHQKCPDVRKAAHLSQEALLGFANGDPAILEALQGFARVQLNLKFGGIKEKCDLPHLAERVKASAQWRFMFQYAEETKDILPLFDGVSNLDILFDTSAGTGINPKKWPEPLAGRNCGYAGGIGPENIADNLVKIDRVVPADYTTWIDMESRIRTNDVFDLAKVEAVAETASHVALFPDIAQKPGGVATLLKNKKR